MVGLRSIATRSRTGAPIHGATAPSRTKPLHLTVGPHWPQDDLTLRPARLHHPSGPIGRHAVSHPRAGRLRRRGPLPAAGRRALVPGLVFLSIGLVAGDIVQLVGYFLLAVGLCRVLRGRRPGEAQTALLDAGLLAVSGAVLIWVYLVLPAPPAAELSLTTLVVAGAHPVGAVVCLGLVARSQPGVALPTPSDGSCSCSPAPSSSCWSPTSSDWRPTARRRCGRVVDRLDPRPGHRRPGRSGPRPRPPRLRTGRLRPRHGRAVGGAGAQREAPARPAGRSPAHPRRGRARGGPGPFGAGGDRRARDGGSRRARRPARQRHAPEAGSRSGCPRLPDDARPPHGHRQPDAVLAPAHRRAHRWPAVLGRADRPRRVQAGQRRAGTSPATHCWWRRPAG